MSSRNRFRGIRTPLQSGYILGRTDKGKGDVHPIALNDLALRLSQTPSGGGGSGLTAIADKTLLSNISGASAVPIGNTLSAILDDIIGATPGIYLNRGASLWQGTAFSLPAQADKTILANISGGSAAPTADTLTAILDAILGNTQGDIIYRNASGWVVLPPGTTNNVLLTGGASANPFWGSVSAANGASRYSIPPMANGNNVDTAAKACKGNIFIPTANITVSSIDAAMQQTVSGTTFKASIVTITPVTYAITGQVAVSNTVNGPVFTTPITHVTSTLVFPLTAPVTLVAGTMYGVLITRTDSTTTAAFGLGVGASHAHYQGFPLTYFDISSTFPDLVITGTLSANTPPTTGTFATTDTGGVFLLGLYYTP